MCFQQFENLSGLRAESFRLWLGREEFSARPCCFELLQGFEQLQEKMYPLQMCSKLPLSAGRTRLRMAASECVNPGNALGCAEKRGASSYEDAPWSFYICSSSGGVEQLGRAEIEGKGIEQGSWLGHFLT